MSVQPNVPGTAAAPAGARNILTEREFDAVRATALGNNPGMTEDMAGRIVTEGIKFVVAAANFPGVPLAPSRVVDEGWHALILHTRLYAALCDRFGPFVHHSPGYDPTFYDPDILSRTQARIRSVGFDIDTDLWRSPADGTIPVAANCQHSEERAIEPMPEPRDPRKENARAVPWPERQEAFHGLGRSEVRGNGRGHPPASGHHAARVVRALPRARHPVSCRSFRRHRGDVSELSR
ncbi:MULTISPECIES: glycine-rich domain-containing protein [Streptomycetaceae]|uniref:Uncharacterized protein n=1 Tax=Streptantibioticus cattleyicolor (strain ATCC 35852 / DSM 46488 / JCM 4925 / NBRC 14057 / NRRL 8057) TaxID=1003195 RepID=F8K0K9_STREN|nr:hypothetical protein [Streptantibioticus cattleyicolor]AEW97415.1 hypothetical protein SCATT_50440 [Streptantibioticus cattleyicolor NRRL 8057 = DSM 46488]MYS61859.1 hypothetical protein [Streptomyces sp. SID5468]CCB77738.1 protein of unknown function [Streptantibioticus cattleyicolor NRRL 8057 = DSM 46488]